MKRITAGVVATFLVAVSFIANAHGRPRSSPPSERAASPVAEPAQSIGSSPNDTARFLAGMPVDLKSPLFPLTQTPAWQQHAEFFEAAFAKLVRGKFARLHNWQAAYLPESTETIPVVYYMFSGPDFMYMDQFLPNAATYVMCGKESMGPPPDPLKMDLGNVPAALQNLQNAMKSALTATYFITQDMKVDLQRQELNGTVPILYVFIARAGKTIRDVTYVSLDASGSVHESAAGRGGTPGVRISYVDDRTGRNQTLFYFTTDISNGGIGSTPGFIRFCDQHGVGATFLKSSSYLMFEDGFSRIRDFLLSHSKLIVQDDSGIPIQYLNTDKWNLRFFGTYVGPIELFKQRYQPKLAELFEQTKPPEFGIGFGYQWDYHKSNLIVATRN
ncbi:MAG: hypothetical protein ACJ8M1_12055 [Chthoniobacterales bacterium]